MKRPWAAQRRGSPPPLGRRRSARGCWRSEFPKS